MEIWSYVAQDSTGAADKLLDVFHRKLELAAARPSIGRDRSDLADSIRSLVCGNYVLFFRPIASGIELVRVLNRHRDLDLADFGP